MAETVIAIGSALSAGVGKAATTVAGLFKGGAGAAAAGTGASTLSNVLTVGSALSSIAGGFAARSAAQEQAEGVRVQEAQTAAQGAQRRAQLAREYEELVGEQDAVVAAAGLNPGVGTPASVRRATTAIADRNLSISRENTRSQMRVLRSRRRSLMSGGRLKLLSGFVDAGRTAAEQFEQTG